MRAERRRRPASAAGRARSRRRAGRATGAAPACGGRRAASRRRARRCSVPASPAGWPRLPALAAPHRGERDALRDVRVPEQVVRDERRSRPDDERHAVVLGRGGSSSKRSLSEPLGEPREDRIAGKLRSRPFADEPPPSGERSAPECRASRAPSGAASGPTSALPGERCRPSSAMTRAPRRRAPRAASGSRPTLHLAARRRDSAAQGRTLTRGGRGSRDGAPRELAASRVARRSSARSTRRSRTARRARA